METEQKKLRENPIAKIGNVLLRFSLKYMPDASIFAIILTILTFLAGILVTDQGPKDMLINWYRGFWELLTFAMQMALMIRLMGGELATADPVTTIKVICIAKVSSSQKPRYQLISMSFGP